jgi:anthranilate phosphoribosyltransferase
MPLDLQDALQRTIEHREIFHDEMLALMRKIMSGEASPVMIAALTVGLRVKKETIGEIAAAAQVMREFATQVDVPDRDKLVDIVGTGGDASHTFNISTASMFVAAAAGARVAKHGGRSFSRRWARISCSSPRRSPHASPRRGSGSCSRPTTTTR